MEKIVVQCSNANHKIQLHTSKLQSFVTGQLNVLPSSDEYKTQVVNCIVLSQNNAITPETEDTPSLEDLKESTPEELMIQDSAIVLMTMTQPVKHNPFTSPVKSSEQNGSINSIKFTSSTKSKMFKQLSNKENQTEESARQIKFVSKNSIKKQSTPLKIQFENDFPRRKITVTPFVLVESTQKLSLQNLPETLNPQVLTYPQGQLIEDSTLAETVPVPQPVHLTTIPTVMFTLPKPIKYQSEETYLHLSNTSILNSPKLLSQFAYQQPNNTSFQFSARCSMENIPYFDDVYNSHRPSYSIQDNWGSNSSSHRMSCPIISDSFDQKVYKEAESYSFIDYTAHSKPKPVYEELVYENGSFRQEIQSFWLNQKSQFEESSFCSTEHETPKLEDFVKGKRLGKGMYGQVFIVQHKTTGFICAMKVLSKQFVKAQKVSDQLIQQLKIHMFMDHPNIVSVYGFFYDTQNVYILQELCTSGQLFDILVRRRRISEKKTAHYIRQMVDALEYIHFNSVIHRDIKPENILLQFGVVKIGDFGWAGYSPTNQYSEKCGTPLYLSPEVIRGQKYNRTADNWGIGLICYELIIGNIPWSIWTEEEIIRIAQEQFSFPNYIKVSSEIDDFINRVLTKYPKNRLSLQEMSKHSFLSSTNPMHYHNEMAGNYGEATP